MESTSTTPARASTHTFNAIRDAYRTRVFATSEVTFPGESAKVRVKLLSERELDLCRVEAIEYVKRSRVDTVVDRDEVLEREVRRQIVWRAFVTSNGQGEDVPFITSDSEVRELDPRTVDRLYEAYLDHQAAIADASLPSAETLDTAIEKALAAGDGGGALLAGVLDARGLRALVGRLFARLRQEQPA